MRSHDDGMSWGRVANRSGWYISHGAQRSMTGPSTRHRYCTSTEWRRSVRLLIHDPDETAALQELAAGETAQQIEPGDSVTV